MGYHHWLSSYYDPTVWLVIFAIWIALAFGIWLWRRRK